MREVKSRAWGRSESGQMLTYKCKCCKLPLKRASSTAAIDRELGLHPHLDVAGRPRQRIGAGGAEKLRTVTKQVYSRIMICSSKVGKDCSCETNEGRETGRAEGKEKPAVL